MDGSDIQPGGTPSGAHPGDLPIDLLNEYVRVMDERLSIAERQLRAMNERLMIAAKQARVANDGFHALMSRTPYGAPLQDSHQVKHFPLG
eukprot:2320392-Amphidinium_carterae.2